MIYFRESWQFWQILERVLQNMENQVDVEAETAKVEQELGAQEWNMQEIERQQRMQVQLKDRSDMTKVIAIQLNFRYEPALEHRTLLEEGGSTWEVRDCIMIWTSLVYSFCGHYLGIGCTWDSKER